MNICTTLEQVAAAEARNDTELLWRTMNRGGWVGNSIGTMVNLSWKAEDALTRIERSRFAAVSR